MAVLYTAAAFEFTERQVRPSRIWSLIAIFSAERSNGPRNDQDEQS